MPIIKKVALVTGASRGIGQAIAKELARDESLTVIGTATSANGASAISHYFSKWGLNGDGVVMDVANPESVDAALSDITSAYGAPQILVNNAGIVRDGLMLRMSEADWQAVIDTNLGGVYRLSKAVLKGMMKARWGRIINITSVVASAGNPGQANYCASKAGIEGFTRSLAHEVGSRGITVNAVAPGFIETDMTESLEAAAKEQMQLNTAVRRLGKPEEVASAVGYLSSEGASFVTGETLHVNGGMYM